MDFKIEFKLIFFSWSYFFIISGFSSKHSNTYSSFYYQEYRFLEGTSLVAEGRVGELRDGGRKRWWGMGKGETVLNNIFKNGFIFLKCTDCRDFFRKLYRLYWFFKKCTDCTDFFWFLYGFFHKFWPPWMHYTKKIPWFYWVPQSNLMEIGSEVHELWSDIQTNRSLLHIN